MSVKFIHKMVKMVCFYGCLLILVLLTIHHISLNLVYKTVFQCNTRFLRQHLGWQGLMMDNSNQNLTINLHRENISEKKHKMIYSQKYQNTISNQSTFDWCRVSWKLTWLSFQFDFILLFLVMMTILFGNPS